MKILTVFATLVAIGSAVLGVQVASGAHRASASTSSLAGTWLYTAVIHCNHNQQNALVCDFKLGNQTEGINWAQIKAKANGTFNFTGGYVSAEDAAKGSTMCNPTILTKAYNGACYMTDKGSGVIKKGITNANDFFITDEHMTYHRLPSNLTVHDPLGAGAYPEDTGVPASVGVYNAKKILTMVGLLTKSQNPPAGLYLKIEVDHHA